MRTLLTSTLLWFSAIGCGLIAGLYFAFSTFIMTSLGRIDQASGIAAMQAINVDILRCMFLPLFLLTSLTCAMLAVAGGLNWSAPGSPAMIAGGLLYVIGMFVVTMMFNVPLNNTLMTIGGTGPEAGAFWARYLSEWTMWNHVRTITSTLATGLFIYALTVR
jgi:uncharacterized membrane protein